ncbi:uncharacterized protein LOC143353752 [Halictus rubicundus]|uniref:uncharacterized protein LOC143353752 n=1 Tax=Halictus rubicundus TaxID=77578 RepID=UPI0040375314
MRKFPLTSLASVVLVVLFFEVGQASVVPLEALEIRNSNDQTNKSAEYSVTQTRNGVSIHHALNLAFYINPVPNTVFRCPQGSCVNNFNNTDYVLTPGIGAHKLFKQVVTWNAARDMCMREGAQLVVINSDAEETLLRTWMSNNSLGGVWIGVHNMFQEDWWVTTTGESLSAMSYHPWAKDRPDNAGKIEHCGVLWNEPAKGIDDCPCEWKYAFVCEINLCEDAEIVAGNLSGTAIANGTSEQTEYGPGLEVIQPAKAQK